MHTVSGFDPGLHDTTGSAAVDMQRLSELSQRAAVSLTRWLDGASALLQCPGEQLVLLDCRGHWTEPYVPSLDRHVVAMALTPLKGCISWVPGEGFQQGDMAEGESLILPAGEPAFVQLPADHHLLVAGLQPRALYGAARSGDTGTPAALCGSMASPDSVLRGLLLTLRAAAEQPCTGGNTGSPTTHLALALAAQLVAQHSRYSAVKRGRLGHMRLERVLAFLDTNLSQDVDLAEAARVAGCSLHHFAHLFKAAVGISPMRYLHQQRMRHARELIETTQLSMAEVGNRVGLTSPSRFSQAFRAFWNVSPSNLRRSG